MSLPHSNEICKKTSIAEFIGMGEPLWLTEFNLFWRHYRTPFHKSTKPYSEILKVHIPHSDQKPSVNSLLKFILSY